MMNWEQYATLEQFRLQTTVGDQVRLTDDGRVEFSSPAVALVPPEILWTSHAVTRAARAPRIVRLDRLDAEGLEHTTLSLPWNEYRQPYPSLIVELPHNYSEKKVAEGSLGWCGEQVRHSPSFVVLDHSPSALIMYVVFDSGDDFYLISKPNAEWDVEDIFAAPNAGGVGGTDQEREVAFSAMRVALNTALLLVNYGCRELPERKQIKRLRRYNKRHKVKGPTLPRYYTFDQQITLYKRTTVAPSAGDGTPKRPHWRRGHWHRVATGVGRTGRELRFIPAVMVNADKLSGGTGGSVSYR